MQIRPLLLIVVLLSLFGCAHQAVPLAPPKPHATDTPLLVINPPPHTLSRFVGRVRGVARGGDFVAAARAADADLRWKAHTLGADVVRIDYVEPPRAYVHGPQVLLAGRAYKAIAHP